MQRHKRALSMLLALVMTAGLLGAASPEAFAAGESVPYAEEQGLEFVTDTAFQIPVFYYLKTGKDGEYIPNTEDCMVGPLRDADYRITELSLSEPDANGMVELTLSYTIDGIAGLIYTRQSDYYIGGRSTGFTFFDYYSGYTLTEIANSENDRDSTETLLRCNGEEINVTWDDVGDVKMKQSPWSFNKYDQPVCEWYYYGAITHHIKFPAEYDGLCLMINKNGITEYSESWENEEEKVSESAPLHEWMDEGETKDDYYFLRVSELLAQQK